MSPLGKFDALPQAFRRIVITDRELRPLLAEKVIDLDTGHLCRMRQSHRRQAEIYLQAQGRGAA